jgi:hypothetical protein
MVSPKNRTVLWARAGGRCQYQGCNKPLIGDLISGLDTLNAAYIAHIVAESPDGPRGDALRSPLLADSVENLMLLCDTHHRLIDREGLAEHPEPRLLAMKAEQERRVELVTGIDQSRASNVLLYGARIGAHDYPVRAELARAAMLPERYPADFNPLTLDMAGVALGDHEDAYWTLQTENLKRQFQAKVVDRLQGREGGHISLFALAPQPLLILLGQLLSDIAGVEVHQLHREPQDWRWREGGAIPFCLMSPEAGGAVVALKLGISATIADERIQSVLGLDTPIWSITTPDPHNDVIQTRASLAAFRRIARQAFDRIKVHHGESATIHVFPAMPLSTAIELGRVWMPKADLPLIIYDQNRTTGGFAPRLHIPEQARQKPASEVEHAA